MAYYPKSQIKSNLYTNGNEYIFPNTEEKYIGYYYEVSNGDTFTGKNPNDGPNERIILDDHSILDIQIEGDNDQTTSPEIPPSVIQNFGNSYYPGDIQFALRSIPTPNLTTPTQPDYKLGEFQRYFTKKNNELKYIEIDKETYTLLKNQSPEIAWDLFTPLTLTWTLTGEQEKVFLVNKKIVALAEKQNKWYGFSQWFKDNFLKYYLEPK